MNSSKRRNVQTASGSGRAAGAAAKRPRASRAKAALTPGLLDALPEQPGPWLARCIERWGLVAPFDPAVSEDQWQNYFQERAVLEWHTQAFIAAGRSRGGRRAGSEDSDGNEDEDEAEEGADGGAEEQQEGQQGEGEEQQQAQQQEWPFEWEKPTSLRAFCRESYGHNEADELEAFVGRMRRSLRRLAGGCKGVAGAAELGEGLARGCFVVHYWSNWYESDLPKTLEMFTRIYSPCALAHSIEFSYKWHHRERMSFSESFCSCQLQLRGAGVADPHYPQHCFRGQGGKLKTLFDMDLQDSGYQKRSFMGAQALRELAAHLLGRKGLIGQRKAFCLAAAAAGTTAVPRADVQFAFRVSRRKHKLLAGEESEHASGDDIDSENEARKGGRSQYVDWDDDDYDGGAGGGHDPWDEQAVMMEYARRKGYGPECGMM